MTARGDKILLSEEDAELAAYSWRYNGPRHGGPQTRYNRKLISLHRLVYERATGVHLPRSLYIDHINRDQLDNRRENLRPARPVDNSANRVSDSRGTSPYKGVYRLKGQRNWIASIMAHGTRIWIGTFEDEREAAYMYDQYAIEIHGQFARLNVLNE